MQADPAANLVDIALKGHVGVQRLAAKQHGGQLTANFFNKGSAQGGTVTATSTLGIRGLGAQDLARSQPNLGAVDQADALRLDGDQARQFASSAALSRRQVDALPEPAPVPPQTSNPAQSNIN